MSKEKVLPKEIHISGQELVDIFQSDKFKRKVFALARKLRESKEEYELGFIAMRSLHKNDITLITFEHVSPFSVTLGDKGLKTFYQHLSKGAFPVTILHFHSPWAIIEHYRSLEHIPSGDDLASLNFSRERVQDELEYNGFSVGVVAIVKSPNTIEMLLFQETPYSITSRETLEDYERDVYTCKTKKEISQALGDYGYKSVFLNYTSKGLSSEDQIALQSFAFSLKQIQKKTS